MRTLIALALALVACSGSDRSDVSVARTASPNPARGPDALLLRVPRNGGIARVTAYPNVDSTVWSSTDAVPALSHVLAFDADAGLIAAVDARGLPMWIDLHMGTSTTAGRGKLRGLASVDGSTIYGVGADGAVTRYTTAGNWVFKSPLPARGVFPQSNGTVLILGGRGDASRLWKMHPPETRITDSASIGDVSFGAGAPLGDRVFLSRAPSSLLAVRARTFDIGGPIDLSGSIRAIATAPSGDRAYVLTDSAKSLAVIDPYQNRVVARAELPGRGRDLRVDPFGRFVLVRAASSDSVWVVSVGTDRVVSTVRSQWRSDLPFVAIDGSIAVLDGRDVVFRSASGDARVSGGAADFWYAFVWNGLRARAASLDQPTKLPGDSDTTQVAVPVTAPESIPAAGPPVDTVRTEFTVSFAALLDETRAREEAAKITVDGQTARVVAGVTAGTAIYRVVIGPFPTRDDAERVGKASGRTYVVYAGTP